MKATNHVYVSDLFTVPMPKHAASPEGVPPEGADPPGGMGRAPLCAGGLPVSAGGGTDHRRTADPVLRPEMTNAGTVFLCGSGVFVIQKPAC